MSSLILSLLSGLLLVFAWPVSGFTLLIFIAWVPVIIDCRTKKQDSIFSYLHYLAMFIWNAGTTWWIWNATAAGAVGAIVANSFLMTIPLVGVSYF